MAVVRKRKIEVARLAGVGLVIAGLFALVLAVVSAQNAGAAKSTAHNYTLDCHDSRDNQLGQAVLYGACSSTTVGSEGGSSTTTYNRCGCSTTSTSIAAETSTSTSRCTCSTTTAMATTSTTEESITTMAPTTMAPTTPPYTGLGNVTTTTKHTTTSQSKGVTNQGGPTSGSSPVSAVSPTEAAEATTGQLPFTGSSAFPLAGLGALMVLSGSALALRRRRLAR